MPRLMSFVVLLLLGFLPASATAADAQPQNQPNILLCIADDWGWPHASAYGDTVVQTPTFDRLAREGLLFEHAFVSSPSCTPSRNAILTGQQFYRLGEAANLHSTLDIKHPNFTQLLQDAGYVIGHWRKVWGPGPFEPGGYTQHPAGPDMPFDQFLQQRKTDQPFCFLFGTSDPHRPYDTGRGAESGIPIDKIDVPAFLPDHEIVRRDIADYYFEVQRWDSDVARALELLEQAGELENTLIVMTGDNGMPFPRCKAGLYDYGARTPLAIRWGKHIAAPGRTVQSFVSSTDLAPTFLAAAGVEVPEVMTGQSLLPLMQNDETDVKHHPHRAFAVIGRERHAAAQEMPSLEGYPSRAIRTERFLFIMNLKPDRWPHGVPANATHPIGQHADTDNGPTKQFILDHRDEPQYRKFYELCFSRRPAEELYDVQNDPDQINNLAADPAHADTVKQLREQLTAYLKKTNDPRFTDQDVNFDELPYRDQKIQNLIREWRERNNR